MRFARVLAFLCPLSAQTLYPVSPASFQYFSYTYQAPNPPPAGALYSLNFPNQAQGGQDVLAACSTYANLQYYFYQYSPSTGWASMPTSGPLIRPTSNFNATTGSIPTLVQGLSFDVSATGQIGSIADPSSQNFQQAWFWSADPCYLAGAEFGFYKLFQGTGANNVVNFYYALNGNCGGLVSGLTQCRSKVDGSNIFPNVAQITLTQPSGANSLGRTDWLWQAYMISSTTFEVRIRDPGTLADAVTPQFVTVQSWFSATAASLYSNGLPGYITITQQRSSALGGITDSMSNPSILTTYGVAAILTMLAPPVTAASFGSLSGYCQQGGYSATTGGVNSTTKVQTSYPNCTVTVYLTGTNTKANIASTSGGTSLSNPFNANSNGYWNFFAPNGVYDVQLSGGSPSIPSPFTLGSLAINNPGNASTILAYPAGGSPGFIGVTDATATNSVTFTSPAFLASSLVFTFPSSIPSSGGCWQSSPTGIITIAACGGGGGGGGGGVTGSVQYLSNTSTITGDSNIIWNASAQQLTVTGIGATAAILSPTGFIQSNGGYYSQVGGTGSYNGAMNTNQDGILVRAVQIASSTAAPLGGYLNISPLTYPSNNPSPLPGIPGGTFPSNSALLWVAGLNTFTPASTAYQLNTNMSLNAPNFIVCNYDPIGHVCLAANYNSFQSVKGGMAAVNFTATNYVQVGQGAAPPCVAGGGCTNPMPTGDSPQAGALYWDTGALCIEFYNGSTWACLAGGGGSPGAPSASVQINNGSGGFGGSSNFTYTVPSSNPLVTIVANGNTRGLNIQNGFAQADQGFSANTTCVTKTCLHAVDGGGHSLAFISDTYASVGSQNTSTPALLTGDSAVLGYIYYNQFIGCLYVYGNSGWACVGGSGGSPGGPSGALQYDNAGSLGGATDVAMTNDAKNTVGNTYLTFSTGTFPQATNNVSIVNSGGSLFFLNNAGAANILVMDQAGNATFTGVVQATSLVATASVYNAIKATGAAGGFLGQTYQASSTAGNAFQCTTNCGATLTTLTANGSGSLVIQALTGQIAGMDLYANDTAWNTIQAPSGGITASTVISSTNFYASGAVQFGRTAPSSSNPYQFSISNDLGNTLDMRDGSSNLIARFSSGGAPAYTFAMQGQGSFSAGSTSQVPLMGNGYVFGGQTGDLLDLTSNGSAIVFKVTAAGGFTASSAAILNGGVSTLISTNSSVYIGTGNLAVGAAGHFYLQVQGLSSPSCTAGPYTSAGNDGYMYFDTTSGLVLRACYNGTSYHVNLTTP